MWPNRTRVKLETTLWYHWTISSFLYFPAAELAHSIKMPTLWHMHVHARMHARAHGAMHVGRIASCSKDKRAILETNDEKYGLFWKVFRPNCRMSTLARGHRCPKTWKHTHFKDGGDQTQENKTSTWGIHHRRKGSVWRVCWWWRGSLGRISKIQGMRPQALR